MRRMNLETATGRPCREAWGPVARRPALGLVLALLALCCPPVLRAQPSAAPNVIVDASLRTVAGGAALDITATGPLEWRSVAAAGDRVFFELVDVLPREGLTGLETATGIVAGVTFETEWKDGQPLTRVIVTTREAAQYTLGSQGTVLTLGFTSVASPTAEAAPEPVRPSPAADVPANAAAVLAQPPSTTEELEEYAIGPGDVVSISVFGVEELDRKTRVQADGQIALPLLGRVKIAGLTVGQAEEEIGRQLRERQLVTQPQVLVVVEEYASYGVTVQGAVVRPGIYPVIGRQSLLEVIWAAGGLVDSTATDQRILVLRQDAAGRSERIEVDAYRLLDEGEMSLNLTLHPGDRVVVPKPQSHKIYVSGAVRRPGPVEFASSSGLTVLQAITLAGGPTERANLGKVTIIRQIESGGQETLKVNVKKVQKGKAQDVFLQNNDTVQVGVWFF